MCWVEQRETQPTDLKALRAENRAHWWGKVDDKSYAWAKQELLEAFVPQNSQWRQRGEMSSRTETCDRPVFNTSITIDETVPIEVSKV